MITGFHDRKGLRLHDMFQAWRRENPNGFFLTFGSHVVHHATKCWHSGDTHWNGQPQYGTELQRSLTKSRKVCSTTQAELLSWADTENVTYKKCSHCIHNELTKRRFKQFEYVDVSSTKKRAVHAGTLKIKANAVEVLEGILQEITTKRRSRSSKLRQAAIDRSRGVCEVCKVDFSRLLDGLGLRVLQAHHKQQLALIDKPILSRVEDIAVLCANCHMLIHTDTAFTMDIADLRQRLLEPANKQKALPTMRTNKR